MATKKTTPVKTDFPKDKSPKEKTPKEKIQKDKTTKQKTKTPKEKPLLNAIAAPQTPGAPSPQPDTRNYNLADWMSQRIIMAIEEFEKELADDEQAGGKLVSFQDIIFSIDDVGYWNPDMIRFYGTLKSGEKVELLQHRSQLNLLLTAVKRHHPEKPRRKIGFHHSPKE